MLVVVDKEIVKGTAVDVGIELAATGLGMVAAGPPGAFLGAAASPLLQAAVARRRAKAELFATTLSDLTGLTPGAIAAWAADEEGRSYLLMSAFDAALASRMENKVRALAALVAEGVNDDARIDYAAVVVDALSQLDAPHYQVLRAMVRESDRRPPSRSGDPVGEGAWVTSQLEAHLPHLGPAIVPICAVLVRTGMATASGLWGKGNDAPWTVLQFGVDCLVYLERAADTKTAAPS